MSIGVPAAERQGDTRSNRLWGSGTSNASKARQGRQSGRRPRVQKQTNNSSAIPSMWRRMEWLREESRERRQRMCGMRAHSDIVSAVRKGDRISYAGLMRCGSRRCPDCGDLLARALRDTLREGIEKWRAAGGVVYFGTMTVRHDRSQSLELLADAVSLCWKRATGGRGWVNDRREHNVDYWVRVQEEKWSEAAGWHVHVHFLLFAHKGATPAPPVEALLASMFDRWRSAAVSAGLGVPLIRAQDLHEIDAGAADAIAGYFAKQTSAAGAADADDMSWELSDPRGSTKTGAGYSPAELLVQAMAGDERARTLWHEYERAMKGRRVVAFSRGFREDLGLGEELTADELAEKQEAEGAVVVLQMRSRMWKKFSRPKGRRAELAERLLRDGPAAVRDWLDSLGVVAVVGRWDEQGGGPEFREPAEYAA